MGYLDGLTHFVVVVVAVVVVVVVVHPLTPVAAVVKIRLVADFQWVRVLDKQYSIALLSLIPDPQMH